MKQNKNNRYRQIGKQVLTATTYREYWSRLPARHLSILSPSAYAALAPLFQSNSLHAPGGTILEMLGHLSN